MQPDLEAKAVLGSCIVGIIAIWSLVSVRERVLRIVYVFEICSDNRLVTRSAEEAFCWA